MPRKGLGSVFYHQAPPPHGAVHAFRETLMEDNIVSAERIISRWDPEGGSEYAKITSLFHESRDEAAKFIQAVHDVHHAMLFFSSSSTQSNPYTALLIRAQGLMQVAMNRLQKEFFQILVANRDALTVDYSDNSLHSSARSSLSDADENDLFRGGSVASSLSATDDEADDVNGSVFRTGTYMDPSEQQRLLLPLPVTEALRSIAHCMISTGYAYECVEVYKRVRTSFVHDGLARLGFKVSATSTPKSQKKMKKNMSNDNSVSRDNHDDPLALEGRVTSWVAAAPAAVRTLFAGERLLSDVVFENNRGDNPSFPSVPINESSFAVIAADAAVRFFAFPETTAAEILKAQGSRSSSKRARLKLDRIFGLLDMYNALADLWPVIESVFSSSSTSHVQKQMHASLAKLAEAVRAMMADLELSIQKDASNTIVRGGGLHQLTRTVMNYIVYLANDYSTALAEIYTDQTSQQPMYMPVLSTLMNLTEVLKEEDDDSLRSASSSFGASSYSSPGDNNVSQRLAWLLLVLLCKLDQKALLYKDRALSYLFLANNLRYMIDRVRGCKRLRHLLGRQWDADHEHKRQSFLRSVERLAWGEVAAAMPSDAGTSVAEKEGATGLRDHMSRFNVAFEKACRRQSGWVVLDHGVGEDIRAAVAATVVEPYRAFYEKYGPLLRADRDSFGVVRFAPKDVANYVADLYESDNHSESGSLSLSGSGHSSPVSPAYSLSGSSSPKTNRSAWRAALRRFTGRRPQAGLWDLGSTSPSSTV